MLEDARCDERRCIQFDKWSLLRAPTGQVCSNISLFERAVIFFILLKITFFMLVIAGITRKSCCVVFLPRLRSGVFLVDEDRLAGIDACTG